MKNRKAFHLEREPRWKRHSRPEKFAMDDHASLATATTASLSAASILARDRVDENQEVLASHLQNGQLLGRERQCERLFESAERYLKPNHNNPHSGIIVISGASGTGKTSLAFQLRDVLPQKNRFLVGKCIATHQHLDPEQPLAPFVQAWDAFLEREFKSSEAHSSLSFQQRVVSALKRATQDTEEEKLFNILPSLCLYLGQELKHQRQRENTMAVSVESSINEASKFVQGLNSMGTGSSTMSVNAPNAGKRFWNQQRTSGSHDNPTIQAACRFLKEFCCFEDPIIFLIDDWQWSDDLTLQFVEQMSLRHDIQGFLLIVTCRESEEDQQGKLVSLLQTLKEKDVDITDIAVGPLNEEDVNQFTSALLEAGDRILPDVIKLSRFICQKTKGNPFLVLETFRTLVDHELLRRMDDAWAWDLNLIVKCSMQLGTLEMLDMTLRRVAQESEHIRSFLQIAASLGSEFEAFHVECVRGLHRLDTRTLVRILVKRGILEEASTRRYRFTHDRWREAALALVEDVEGYRFWVGRQLAASLTGKELVDASFGVSQLLYPCAHSLHRRHERVNISQLFCMAGMRAAQYSAFDIAAVYFKNAIDLLPEGKRWDEPTYTLSLNLHSYLAEMAGALGRWEEVDNLVEIILQYSRDLQDKVRAYETKMHSLCARDRLADASDIGFHMLNLLGSKMSPKSTKFSIIKDVVSLVRLARSVTEEKVLKLPMMQNWKHLAISSTFVLLGSVVVRYKPELMLRKVVFQVRHIMTHGLSSRSGAEFASMAVMLCSPLGMVDEGLRIVKIADALYKRYPTKQTKCRMQFLLYGFVLPWKEPIRNVIPELLEGARAGMLSGDLEMAGLSYVNACSNMIFAGYPLREVWEENRRLRRLLAELGQHPSVLNLERQSRLLDNLLGTEHNPEVLTVDDFALIERMKNGTHLRNDVLLVWITLSQNFLAVIHNDLERAVQKSQELSRMTKSGHSGFLLLYVMFLRAWSLALLARERSRSRKLPKLAAKALKQFQKKARAGGGWCNKISLVQAELFALQDRRREDVILKWSYSIQDAEHQSLIHEQAFAHERLGRCFLHWGEEEKGFDHLRQAMDLYSDWGCACKVDQMRTFFRSNEDSSSVIDTIT